MAQREIREGFSGGSSLIGAPDMIPDTSLRFLQNARLDRTAGAISVRPGISSTGATAAGDLSLMLHKRVDTTSTTYQQTDAGDLYVMGTDFSSLTLLGTGWGSNKVFAANMADGAGTIWAHFTNASLRAKHNGSLYYNWGIYAATAVPSAVALATDLTTTIDAMDNAASWTGSGLSAGPTNEANILQEGANSVTFTIAANTLGSMGQGGLALNLDTLSGGDSTVKDDDYIFLWLRCDRPDRVVYVQLDFDLDTATLANAFRTNYYSVRLPGLSRLNQGRDQWTKLQVRKSEFQRFGTNTSLSWANVKSVRISALTSNDGAVQFYADDFKLRGGTDIEGDVEYTIAYRNSVSGARGNPYLVSGEVQYTTKLTVDRQRVSLTTANVIQGGASHSGDTQIDKIILYRRINGGDSVKIVEFADTTASPYTDSISVASTLLNSTLEDTVDSPGDETTNDVPPAGECVFGPGAYNRLFMLQGNNLYFSKAWESGEGRSENWPSTNRAVVGGGADIAMCGVATDTQIIVWTNRQTYQIIGSGEDTFLPVAIPNSHGIVARHAMDEGDGRIFFFSWDGLYEQVGLQQMLVVDLGTTLMSSDININRDALSNQVIVQWHADIKNPYVCCLIPVNGSTTPNARLIVKKNPQTGHYTDVILDSSNANVTIRSLYADDATNTLYAGDVHGQLYQLEDHDVTDDAGYDIDFQVRTKSYHQGVPHQAKQYFDVVVEADTNSQTLLVDTYYNKEETRSRLGEIGTDSVVGTGLLNPANPLDTWRSIALGFSLLANDALTIYRFGWHYQTQAEPSIYWDSGVLVFPTPEVMKRFTLDIDAPSDITVQPYYDGVAGEALPAVATDGRQQVRVWLPPGTKPRTFRVTLTSSSLSFKLYGMTARDRAVGNAISYNDMALTR